MVPTPKKQGRGGGGVNNPRRLGDSRCCGEASFRVQPSPPDLENNPTPSTDIHYLQRTPHTHLTLNPKSQNQSTIFLSHKYSKNANMADTTDRSAVIDETPISPVRPASHVRQNSLEKHLQHRPDPKELRERHILLDSTAAP